MAGRDSLPPLSGCCLAAYSISLDRVGSEAAEVIIFICDLWFTASWWHQWLYR